MIKIKGTGPATTQHQSYELFSNHFDSPSPTTHKELGVDCAAFKDNEWIVTRIKDAIQDWDNFLYSLWLERMAYNPGFYSDAKRAHKEMSQICVCEPLVFPRNSEKGKRAWIVYSVDCISRKTLLYIHTYTYIYISTLVLISTNLSLTAFTIGRVPLR